MFEEVTVVSITEGGYYFGEHTSGSTVNVTLKRGEDFATCEGILIWEEEYVGDDLFDEWVAYAVAGEEGYTAILVEGDETVLYGA
jgi:hypothetical protein